MNLRSVLLLVSLIVTATSQAEETSPPGRVLFIGIDGCRYDALEAAKTPQLAKLRSEGCYSRRTLILGPRYRGNDTVSGPGWSSLLTGVWADKHGVDGNKFNAPRIDEFPHFFQHVKKQWPQAETVSIAGWPPIKKFIVRSADVNLQPSDAERYVPGDADAAKQAIEVLQQRDPHAMFVYFGQVDEHGHSFGFHPSVPEYIAAIERVDAHLGSVLTALHARPRFADEKWLVLVSSDHGGLGKNHGRGHDQPEVFNSFTIISGAVAERGELPDPTYLVDVPVTALAHLGVPLTAEMKLDGHPIGLRGIKSSP